MAEVDRVRVGGIEVLALTDGEMQAPVSLFPDYEPERARAAAAMAGTAHAPGDPVTVPVRAFVLRTAGTVALVDTGSPPGFSERTGMFSQALARAGVAPETVTHLLMTHLHIDHVGGLTGADGAATFAAAELVSGAGDWAYFHSDEVLTAANERARASIEVSRRCVAPYAGRRRELTGEAEVLPGITMVPLPGHTPGHVGYLLSDGDAQLLIWGDTIHCEALQIAEPDWGVRFDVDPDAARQTRRRLFDRVASDGVAVMGPHLSGAAPIRLKAAGDGYRMERAG